MRKRQLRVRDGSKRRRAALHTWRTLAELAGPEASLLQRQLDELDGVFFVRSVRTDANA